jgi:hypothetical protein
MTILSCVLWHILYSKDHAVKLYLVEYDMVGVCCYFDATREIDM